MTMTMTFDDDNEKILGVQALACKVSIQTKVCAPKVSGVQALACKLESRLKFGLQGMTMTMTFDDDNEKILGVQALACKVSNQTKVCAPKVSGVQALACKVSIQTKVCAPGNLSPGNVERSVVEFYQ